MSPSMLRSVTYVPVSTHRDAVSVAERIARTHRARVVSGWGAAADVLGADDPAAELVAISEDAHRTRLRGATAARASSTLRQHAAAWEAEAPAHEHGRADASPAEAGAATERLWATRGRLRHLENRSTDIVRIARGMVIAAAGSSLILAGTETVEVVIAVAIGVVCMLAVVAWWVWTWRRAIAARRSLNDQLAALGASEGDHLAWLDTWTAAWDARFASAMSMRDDTVEVSEHARRYAAAHAYLQVLRELEAAAITAANELEAIRARWEAAIADYDVPPVPLQRADALIPNLVAGSGEPVVVAAASAQGVDAERVRVLLQRPTRRSVWVVAPGVDAWGGGRSS